MTFYFMTVSDGYVKSYGSACKKVQIAIAEEVYNAIVKKVEERPSTPDGYVYMLNAKTLEWELVELPPMPEPELTDEEALEILLGGAT